jgi:hypothetical protein
MANKKKEIISVQGVAIKLVQRNDEDYISLTDMAKYRDQNDPFQVIANWMRLYGTVSYLGLWEQLNNQEFKPFESERFKSEAGREYFSLTPKKWIETTNAIGIISKSGRYGGGTFAHSDIAFKFAAWLSPEFELYLIREFKRLKLAEQERLSLEWDLQRTISKINYRIHTDAVKAHIIPPAVTKEQASYVYASEADMLNVALFGKTAAQWRKQNPSKDGNMRDDATIEQLIVLSNMESINALLIKQGMPQGERLVQLNQVAITQMTSLVNNHHIKQLANTAEAKKKQ